MDRRSEPDCGLRILAHESLLGSAKFLPSGHPVQAPVGSTTRMPGTRSAFSRPQSANALALAEMSHRFTCNGPGLCAYARHGSSSIGTRSNSPAPKPWAGAKVRVAARRKRERLTGRMNAPGTPLRNESSSGTPAQDARESHDMERQAPEHEPGRSAAPAARALAMEESIRRAMRWTASWMARLMPSACLGSGQPARNW